MTANSYVNIDAQIEFDRHCSLRIQLANQFVAKVPITLNFPQVGGAFNLKDPNGGLVSSFSTYGPTYDMYFKPAVAAPGGNILSTIPVKLGAFAVESGTSMATPFTAGAAALVLQVKGRNANVGRSIKDLFQTTVSSVSSSNTDGGLLQTISQQGAGIIQVDRAALTTTIVSPGQLTLDDTANFHGSYVCILSDVLFFSYECNVDKLFQLKTLVPRQ